ncbi:MAG: DUF1343 domain-containing protein [Treponema sp.]|jgi:uncharacterized protein YbbC (DUF1343 family)|nr:DUF1343 domain-containing protein [Treponema sp.]
MEVLNGIDRLITEDFGLKGKRLGLITNHSGLTKTLVSSIDVLNERFNLRALFGPEHGIRGDIEAGGNVDTYTDKRTGLPVYSIYGNSPNADENNRPAAVMLKDIDTLLIDIQDVGSRFYTFESTLYNSMEVCAKAGKIFVVLDRVNPINGADVEGNILDTKFRSFVGVGPIPNRHGMTMGELAGFYNRECGIGCDLKVISISGWKREMYGDEAGFHWVNPSPNIPNIDAALLYPGTCLFEGTCVSEGRGTTRPFELIGAPWLDADALAETMIAKNIPGVIFRPAAFLPSFSKFTGEFCRGVQLHITDRKKMRPVNAAINLLEAIRGQSGEKFSWLQGANDRCFIDLLAGTDILRKGSSGEYLELCEKGEKEFAEKRRPYLIY